MLDTKYTEKQYAFQLFDFAAEQQELKHGTPYLIECRAELLKLVNDQANSANFWHARWFDLAKEVMRCAGLPDDFATSGTGEAFEKIRQEIRKADQFIKR
jgi:hypothetical protein